MLCLPITNQQNYFVSVQEEEREGKQIEQQWCTLKTGTNFKKQVKNCTTQILAKYPLFTLNFTSNISLMIQTRYSIKYRHVDGKLVLKVTNDKVVSSFAL